MASKNEYYQAIDITLKLIKTMKPNSREAGELYRWVERWISECIRGAEIVLADCTGPSVPNNSWVQLSNNLEKQLKKLSRFKRDVRIENLATLATSLGLKKIDQTILEIILLSQVNILVQRLFSDISDNNDYSNVIGALCDIPVNEVRKRLYSSESALSRSGLLRNTHFDSTCCNYEIISIALTAIEHPSKTESEIRAILLGGELKTALGVEDYNHIQKDRDMLIKVLSGAIQSKEKGINILLYGPAGTGKTELCKVIASHLKEPLYAVGEQDDDGREPDNKERSQALCLSQKLLARSEKGLLLCDEMEDFWKQSMFRYSSRVYAHRMLENNAVPVFWTCNNIESFDPALLRRMTLAIELKTPPVEVREGIWKKLLTDNNLVFPADEIKSLATQYIEAPGIVSNAVRATKLSAGGVEETRYAIASLQKAMRGGFEKILTEHNKAAFTPALAAADTNLEYLVEKLKETKQLAFSACFYGHPGTGKSAFARHLALKLGLEVVQKRASDLLSMWVGGSEKNIAAAFAEARHNKALLIFDEADSLISDRKYAAANWEVSQINEMLTWMENHPYPLVCTTNLMERLDIASLRRFDFKIGFDYLDRAGTSYAFTEFFGFEPPESLRALTTLTPGDFVVAKKKARILGVNNNIEELVSLLRKECMAKAIGNSRKIGFNMET